MSSLLADRLKAVRHETFVGRVEERALFLKTIKAETLPFNVLFVYGPGGIGKTTLLREFAEICAEAGCPFVDIDARNVDPTPSGFLEALQNALGSLPSTGEYEYLSSLSGRFVFGIDTYEDLGPLDEWILKNFLPQLPENVLVILAGRQPPSTAWRTDPGWQALTRVLPLRYLSPEESVAYLQKRALPESQHPSVLKFTHGHPLALSLVADVFAQREKIDFSPEASPDIVKELLEQLVQQVPGPAHRSALEACALVRVTTEGLLSAILDNPEVHELFEWLRSLSFIDTRPAGLFPHDLARDALVADLRWRNPDWYAELKHRSRVYYTDHIVQTTGHTQLRNLIDLVYLHRDNALVRPYFEWQTSGSTLVDSMQRKDLEPLLAMVLRHEGARSAEIAGHWLNRQPDSVLVTRDPAGNPSGFLMMVDLERAREENELGDPAVNSCSETLERLGALRQGEKATLFRYWMAADTYQGISAIQSLLAVHIVRHCLVTPGLAFVFIPCAQENFWEPAFTYADLNRLVEADYEVGGRKYAVFGHDWRTRPTDAWLELLAEREISTVSSPVRPPANPEEQLVVLSRDLFGESVRNALRTFTSPNELRGNLLLRSRLVVSNTGVAANEAERILKLSEMVIMAAESLRSSPRGEKYFKALDKAYFHPAPTQEIAAELLDLPFSSFRRHLKAGIDQVTEILWQKEIGH
jgi:hypothetical protein